MPSNVCLRCESSPFYLRWHLEANDPKTERARLGKDGWEVKVNTYNRTTDTYEWIWRLSWHCCDCPYELERMMEQDHAQ